MRQFNEEGTDEGKGEKIKAQQWLVPHTHKHSHKNPKSTDWLPSGRFLTESVARHVGQQRFKNGFVISNQCLVVITQTVNLQIKNPRARRQKQITLYKVTD